MNQRLKQLLLIFGDMGILLGSLWVTVQLYGKAEEETFSYMAHLKAFGLIFPLWIVMFYIEGIYSLRTFNRNGMTVSLMRASIINIVFSFIFFYLFSFNGLTPKTNIIVCSLIVALSIFIYRKIFFAFFSSTGLALKVCAIGKEDHINEIEEVLKDKPYLGFEIDSKSAEVPKSVNADMIAVDQTFFSNETVMKSLLEKLDENIAIMEMSTFSELVTGKIHPSSIDGSWFIRNVNPRHDRFHNIAKTILDRGVALLLLLIVIPIYVILIPFLLLVSGRPIFYSQIRTGLRNQPFRIYKLRTMSVNAEKAGKAQWATPGDARVTPIGKFLRMTRLDELPQLWNILNGDMSIVGPRPERPEIIEKQLEPTIPFYRLRHLVKPGVTGWAQVNYRYGYSEEDSLIKLTYDLYYVKNKSIWLDIRIILKTIKTVITGMGH
jgi:exopolysaccharide biosynthesis polyprenyl glycosylphosphotransferase